MQSAKIRFASYLLLLTLLNGCWLDSPEDTLKDLQQQLQQRQYRSAEITGKALLQDLQTDGDLELQRATRLLLARVYFEIGDVNNAARFYDALPTPVAEQASPTSAAIRAEAEDWHRWLLSAWEAGDTGLASNILNQAPFGNKARETYKIRQLLAQGRRDDAQAVLELTTPPAEGTSPYVHYQYALMLAGNDNAEQALQQINDLLEENPDFAEAARLQAHLLQMTQSSDAALQAYLRYLELRPADAQSRIATALLALQTADYERGRKQVEVLTKLAPEHPMVLQLRGMLALHDKDFDEAKSLAEQSLARGLESPMNHMMIGVGAYQQQSWETANRHLLVINEYLPQNHFARKMLVETKLQINESKQAAAIFRDIDTSSMVDVALANRVSAKLIQEGGFATANAIQAQVADIDIDRQELVVQRQALSQALKRNEFKQALIESMKAQNPEAQDRLRLILLHIADNELEKAGQMSGDWLRESPRDVNALNAAAMLAQRQGNRQRVKEYLAQALASDPNNIPSLVLQLNENRIDQQWADVAQTAEKLMLDLKFINPAVFVQWLEANRQQQKPAWDQALALVKADDKGQLEGVWLAFLLQSRQFQVAQRYLQEQVQPENLTSRHAAAAVLAAVGMNEPELAAQKLQALIDSDHFGQQRMAEFTVTSAIRLNRFDLVLKAIEQADRQSINFPNRELFKASAHIRLGQFDKARTELKSRAVEDADFFEVRADLEIAQEDYRKAWDDLEKAVATEITPARLHRMFSVGNKVNKRSAVKDYIRDYFKAKPADTTSRRLMSQWYLEDSPRFAIELLDSPAMQKQLETDWVSTNNLAWLYHQVGDTDKAKRYAEHAISHAPERAEVIDTYETVFGHKPGAQRLN